MRIRWKVRRRGNKWDGSVEFPLGTLGAPVAVTATANNGAAALVRGGDLASRLADNPAIAALLPPGGALALKALASPAGREALSKAGKKLKKVFG